MKNCNSAVYGLGFIGALVYYVQQANGLGELVMGLVKSIVWPAIVTYRVLEYFQL